MGTEKIMDEPFLAIAQMHSIKAGKVKKGLQEAAHNNKILVYKTDPDLIELLDINNDRIFLEPLLFGYFNNLESDRKISLAQILYGYIKSHQRPSELKILFTKNRAYLPNLGTIELSTTKNIEIATLLHTEGTYQLVNEDNENIAFQLSKIAKAGEFEIIKNNHPFFYKFFKQANPEVDLPVIEGVDTDRIATALISHVERAIEIIKSNCPVFYQIAALANSKILLFDCEQINSFATKSLQGLVFLSSSYQSSGVSFYIDDLIHQWSHNILNILVFDSPAYFKVDIERLPFAPYSTDPNEKRDIFNTFHGLLTTSLRAGCFREIVLKDNNLCVDERQELMARYIDQDRRYKNGLKSIPLKELFTSKGCQLFHELDQLAFNCLGEIREQIERADFSNQVSRFSFTKFCEINGSLKEFQI